MHNIPVTSFVEKSTTQAAAQAQVHAIRAKAQQEHEAARKVYDERRRAQAVEESRRVEAARKMEVG